MSVDCCLSSEASFPAAWDDSLAAYKCTLANAASTKGDPKKLALAGERAGGHLAVATAIAVRDAGLQAPLHVLALYPDAKLQGLPPVTLISAQIDPLQSDGVMLDKALKAAGIPVERKNYDGVTHEFFGMAAVVKKAKDAQEYAGQRLKRALGR